jgi:tetratricopeptide (TPR) repeat protein
MPAAHEHIAAGLALAEARGLRLPLQYLYSTRGEIALAEQQWGEAESWFTRGLAISERMGDARQIANYRANLALAARGRGDLDGALMLFEAARDRAAPLDAAHLQTQIDLWLAELHFERGERTAADGAEPRRVASIGCSRRCWIGRPPAERQTAALASIYHGSEDRV